VNTLESEYKKIQFDIIQEEKDIQMLGQCYKFILELLSEEKRNEILKKIDRQWNKIFEQHKDYIKDN